MQLVAIFDAQANRDRLALVVHTHRHIVIGMRANVLRRYDCVESAIGARVGRLIEIRNCNLFN